jgi:hypothetical protein
MNGPFLDPLMTEQVWEGAQGHIQKKACGEDSEQYTFSMPEGMPIPLRRFPTGPQSKQAPNAE